jgi:hypothetical protein
MATKTIVRNILSAIKSAPHSVSPLDVKHSTGIDLAIIKTVISQLVSAQYLKENRECANSFFTRKPKRNEITTFLTTATASLPGVYFDVEGPTTIEAQVLRKLRNAPHAIGVHTMNGEWPAVKNLVALGICKEHRDQGGAYFVRKEKRADVDAYLAGTKTYEQLVGTATVSGSTPAGPSLDPEAVATAKLLHFLRTAPSATQVPSAVKSTLDELVCADIVKEHRDKPGFYFVRKINRELVDSYLDGTLALDALYDKAVLANEPEPETPICVSLTEPTSVTDATEALMDEVSTIVERLNAILAANGR